MVNDERSLRMIGRATNTPFVQYAVSIEIITGIWQRMQNIDFTALHAVNSLQEHVSPFMETIDTFYVRPLQSKFWKNIYKKNDFTTGPKVSRRHKISNKNSISLIHFYR